MPCKCLTGCINKKCSCRAKGIDCTDECAYCKKDDSKYECFNLPGKVPPILPNSKSNANSTSNSNSSSRRSSRNNSKIIEISYDSEIENETEDLVVKTSKEITKPKNGQEDNKTSQQTVIINNYYYNEYKQQNNAFTQVNHNYELAENSYNGSNTQPGVNNLIKTSNNDTNTANTTPSSTIPKLTESLAGDFLKFYWECLSDKNKTKYLEKYICSMAELKIQEVPFIGAGVITKRLEEAAPIKINAFQHKIFPIVETTPTTTTTKKKFSDTNINNNKLLNSSTLTSPPSSSSSTLLSLSNPTSSSTSYLESASPSPSNNLINYYPNSNSNSNSNLNSNVNSNVNSNSNVNPNTNLITTTAMATDIMIIESNPPNNTPTATTGGPPSKGLVFTDPNLPGIGRIEANGVMMDQYGNTAQFTQNYYLVYNRTSGDVQLQSSELKWL